MLRSYFLTTSAVALLLGEVIASPVSAQQLEEIVVTARKREENLMQVPLAITAFSSQEIENRNIKQMTDLTGSTPSFYFVNQTGGASGFNDRSSNILTFRGLYSPSNAGLTAGGLLFVDGAPVLNAQAPSLTEIERVEVLKGPQSAYFGRSTFAGAINFVTRDPSLTNYKGRISAEYSSYGSNEEQLSFEGPVVRDILAFRVSGRYYKRGGMYTNAGNTNEMLGDQSTKSLSAQVLFQPSENFKAKAFVESFRDDDGPQMGFSLKSAEFNCFAGGRTLPAGSRNNNYICGAIPDSDQVNPNIISGNYSLEPAAYNVLINNVTNKPIIFDPHFMSHGGLRRSAVQANLKLDYEFGDGYTLSTLSAYHRDKRQSLIDLSFRDGRNQPNQYFGTFGGFTYTRWEIISQAYARDYSQEVRLTSPATNRFRFTVGGNYINLYSPGGTVYGYGTLAVGGVGFFASVIENKVQTPAVFGGAYYDLVEGLTLSLEARYQWDKIRQQSKIGSNGLPTTGAGAQPLQNTFKSFSPRVSLDYKFAPNSTVYALWSRGYRPGGFNAVLYTTPASVVAQFAAFGALPAYQQEKLDNFEGGVKGMFLENRARATLAVYYDKYANGQVSNTIPFNNPDGSLNLASAIVNTGRIDLKGVELESELQASEALRLMATLALNDTDIKAFLSSDGTQVKGNNNVVGNHTPTAPKWTWSLGAEYTGRLSDAYKWFARVDYNHIGRYYVDFSNVAYGNSRDLVALRTGVRSDSLTIEGFVTNLLQDKTPPSAFLGNDTFTGAATNEIRYALPVKRQFGVRARYNF